MKKILFFAVYLLAYTSCGSDPLVGEEKCIIVVKTEGKGKVVGAGAFAPDEVCTLKAKPDSLRGYRFSHWVEMPDSLYINSDKVYSFQVDESRKIKAIFIKDE